ncbi:MAG: hypothetical protein ACR2NN_13135 [Bryobacteraceae bacterium]
MGRKISLAGAIPELFAARRRSLLYAARPGVLRQQRLVSPQQVQRKHAPRGTCFSGSDGGRHKYRKVVSGVGFSPPSKARAECLPSNQPLSPGFLKSGSDGAVTSIGN